MRKLLGQMIAKAIAALLIIAMLGITTPAMADNHWEPGPSPGCVTIQEFWDAPYPATQKETESSWHAKGVFESSNGQLYQLWYPRCGKDFDPDDYNSPHIYVNYTVRGRMSTELFCQ